MKLKHIPNILSVIRICMVFLFIYLFFAEYSEYHRYHALGVFILAGATDVLDGILARRFGWVTDLGKLLDPLADKLMQCTALICLFVSKLIPWWVLAVLVLKEVMMGFGALYMFKSKQQIVVSRWFGKAAVCIFYLAIFLIIVFNDQLGEYIQLIYGIVIATALAAITSYFMDYIWSARKTKEPAAPATERKEC